ncbi:MAG: cellulase family glycosylhydrolase [Sphingobium sp.]
MNSRKAIYAAGLVAASTSMVWAATTLTTSSTTSASSSVVTIPATAAASTAVPVAAESTAGTAMTQATVAAKALPGVNISGGEFGGTGGKLGTNYIYPSKSEISYYAAQGFKVLRIPFRWERLQPTPYAALSATDRNALKTAVTQANALGLTVVLDMHNYGQRQTSTGTFDVGSANVTAEALTDAWVKIMEDYRGNPQLWVGLMNEPNRQSPDNWWRIANQVVQDLRNQKIDNKILVPGTAWTGAHSWISSGNAARAAAFVDPSNNYAFEVHQYLDGGSAGIAAPCQTGSAARVEAALQWAEARGVQLFFGEMGGSSDPQCAIEYPAMLRRLNSSPAVLAWTAWGGGAWWNVSYMFRLQSTTTQPTAHMAMLNANMPQ